MIDVALRAKGVNCFDVVRPKDAEVANPTILASVRRVEGLGWFVYPRSTARKPSRHGHRTAEEAIKTYRWRVVAYIARDATSAPAIAPP